MARLHPDYGQDTLMVQSMIHTVSRLVPSKTKGGQQVEAQQRLHQRAMQKNPAKISGKHVYVQELVATAK
eukprot:1367016-Lingulodinium_polyedra.AAC.1